jgi:acyl-ACP thioesterase
MTDNAAPIYEQELRIKALDCDVNRQVKPAALFQRLSEAAGTHATRLGAGFEAMAERGLTWVHARMKVQVDRYPHLGDTVTLRTWPKTIRRRLLYIRDFEVVDAAEQRLAAATSAWLIVDAATHRIVRPRDAHVNLPAPPDRVGLDDPLDKLSLETDGEAAGTERLRVRAGYSAVDVQGHVNNSRYVEWICDAFPVSTFRDHQLEWLQINYTHEVMPDEEVAILADPVADDPGVWAVVGHNWTGDNRAFEALMRWRE